MIFYDKLQELDIVVGKEFDLLIAKAWENQSHPGDLLLQHINGFFDHHTIKLNENHGKKYNPHSIGPGTEGHSENTHYKFINLYRVSNVSPHKYNDYLKLVQWSPDRQDEINRLEETEAVGIQLEMLIYIKFWEADMIIKKLYQFVRLLNGEPYDWYFKIKNSNKDKDGTGFRKQIITSKIGENIKNHSKLIYDLLNNTYKSQIRNSIAHSNYSIMGRYIQLNNYNEFDNNSQIIALPFDDWINIFHNTMILYNQYIGLENKVDELYQKIAAQNNNEWEIRITEKNGKQTYLPIIYRTEWKDWVPKNNL